MSGSDAISPTAHYTGYVWARHGLSHRELETRQGRVLFESLQPTMCVSRTLGGDSLEAYLLARHRAIDALLERAIERDRVTQVIEVACGLSPRGWRFTQRHRDLVYVEADLPAMAARKRRALERMGSLSERHRVAEADALRDEDVFAVAAGLDRAGNLAIVTEGLLTYLPREALDGMWRRFATVLGSFAGGRYLSDVRLASIQTAQYRVFQVLLGAFVRGRAYVHFYDAEDATAALERAGFTSAAVVPASRVLDRDGLRTNILEASTR